jgi:hypothetical protein
MNPLKFIKDNPSFSRIEHVLINPSWLVITNCLKESEHQLSFGKPKECTDCLSDHFYPLGL